MIKDSGQRLGTIEDPMDPPKPQAPLGQLETIGDGQGRLAMVRRDQGRSRMVGMVLPLKKVSAIFSVEPANGTLQMFTGNYRDFTGKLECRDFKFMEIACIPAIPVILKSPHSYLHCSICRKFDLQGFYGDSPHQ